MKERKAAKYIMRLNNRKNHLSRTIIFFIMLLFAMCLTMNAFLSSTYNLDELSNKNTVIARWKTEESIAADGEGDYTTCFNSLVLNRHSSYDETITKNTGSIFTIAVVSRGFRLLLFLVIIFLLYLFILLPDGWTLINQKVRLDN